ncbi:MAG: AI-2E family transporter [Candidatus Uhrbacteria bacterium]|nr:AI-2E family transporter [Candidatus Uhrbacteria bacterium]
MPPLPPRIISISTGTIVKTIGIFVALGGLWLIRDIVLYVFIAILLAGVIYPFARWAAAHHFPKGLAVLIFYLLFFGLIGLILTLLIPIIVTESKNLVSTFGGSASWINDASNVLKEFSDRHGFSQNLRSSLDNLSATAPKTLGSLFGIVTSVFGGIAGFIIVLVLSFYLIVEDEAVRKLFLNIVPLRYHEFAVQAGWSIIDKLGSWLRGQLVLGLIIGTLYFIGFSLIGVPYALLLAILGGLLEFIPYVGPFIAAVPAIYLALSDSPLKAVVVLILIVIIQQLENNVIVPKVMQKVVGLNPIVSIVAFMIGAKLFGVVGAIFAIPVATAISVAWSEGMRFRREHGGV